MPSSFERLVAPDVSSQLSFRQADRRVLRKLRQCCVKLLGGRELAFEKLVADPKNSVHLDAAALSQRPQL